MYDVHHRIWRTLTLLTTCVLLLPLSAVRAVDFPSARGTIKLHYEHALLSAEIKHAALAEVLVALQQLTGAQVRTLGALHDDGPISVTVHAVPLAQGIRKLLKDVSYVLQAHETGLTVHVLLGQGIDHTTTMPVALPAVAEHHAPLSPEASPSLAWQEPSGTAEEHGEPTYDDAGTQQAQAHMEERLARALTVLHSPQAHMHGEALDQLAYSNDARAIEALTQVAMGTLEVAPAIRAQAATALARHALQQASSDPSLVSVLEQLASNRDDKVRAVARQTLEDLQQQQE
jgi:hypothetical protein